jgi:hypothetical protein
MASICSEDKPVEAHSLDAAIVSCLLGRKHTKRKNAESGLKYKAKLEFLYILPIYRSVRQWSSKLGQASEKGKIEAGEKGGGMHMQQNVTCPEVAGTGNSINRFATHSTRVTVSIVTKCESTTTDQRANRMETPNIVCQKEV